VSRGLRQMGKPKFLHTQVFSIRETQVLKMLAVENREQGSGS